MTDEDQVLAAIERIRDEIKAGVRNFHYSDDTGVPGTSVVMATTRRLTYPIGLLWYHWRNKFTIDIQNVYVEHRYRRCGIGRFLQSTLLAMYPDVEELYSQSGTQLGAAWMQAMGYRQDQYGWSFDRDQLAGSLAEQLPIESNFGRYEQVSPTSDPLVREVVMVCKPDTYEIGDGLALTSKGGCAMVEKTTDPMRMCGRATRRYSDPTREVRFAPIPPAFASKPVVE